MSKKILEILDRARWAPSGDNTQPWKFEILGENEIRIHLFHNQKNVYEYKDSKPIWLTAGTLVENIRLIAGSKGMVLQISKIDDFINGTAYVNIHFENGKADYDQLEKYIETRTVKRTAFRMSALPPSVKEELEKAAGPHFALQWHTSFKEKFSVIRLNMLATKIRLSIREAYEVHREMIDWDNDLSPYGVPAKALGMSKLTLIITKWAMKSWQRMAFLLKYLGGTIAPRLELDIIPGLCCAAHLRVYMKNGMEEKTPAKLLDAGAAVQRIWLTATKFGLCFQPSLAPLIFASHAKENKAFTSDLKMRKEAERLLIMMRQNTPYPFEQQIFQMRIGYPIKTSPSNNVRSIRRPLSESLL